MKNKKKLYIILTIIILGILAIVGFSYAYFSGILGTGNDITISSARLGLIYEDGTNEITADTSKPGSIYEKTFKATNESDTVIKYNIEWIDVENTYVVKEELVYRIEKLDGTVVVEETVMPSEDGLIIGGITINPSEVHEYKLIIEFKNLEENSLDNMGKVFNGKIEVNTDSYSTEFAYTGAPQTFNVPEDGYYEVELWGSGNAGHGSYTSGKILLTAGENLHFYVAGESMFNGGMQNTYMNNYSGGATDIRLIGGTWNNSASLRSRIMVSAGGSTAGHGGINTPGGGLIGINGLYSYASNLTGVVTSGTGGTQTTGGIVGTQSWPSTDPTNGYFGVAGTGESNYQGHGSAGYYGGGGAGVVALGRGAGGSGSSYISGYGGVNSVLETGGTTTQPLHTNNTIHYSGKYFIDPVMLTGAEEMTSIEGNETVGNDGDGKAKITYLGKPTPKKITTDLNSVRYIKDCINGSSVNTLNWWNDIQAIKDGTNIALGKTVIGTTTQNATYPHTRIVDGNMLTDGGHSSGGLQCVTVDLGQEYDLDEVVVWHYYQDGRIYNNHTLSVGATNTSGTISLSTVLINNRSNYGESSQGFRFSAYESDQRKYYNITTETVEGQTVKTPTSQSAGDSVRVISQFTDSNLYGGVIVKNAETNEEYITVPKTDITFIMPAFDIIVTPIVLDSFNITKVNATGGTFSIATTAEAGTTVSFTTTQSTGYYYNGATVTYSGGSINLTAAQKSFTMPSNNVTITPRFAKYNYSITKMGATGGSISSIAGSAQYGQAVSFSTNQLTGYYYNGATVSYSGGSINLTSAQKSFTMPAANVTVTPRFAKYNHAISRTAITGGSTNSVSTAQYGQSVTFSLSPYSGFTYIGANLYNANTGGLWTSLSSSVNWFTMPNFPVRIQPSWQYNSTQVFKAGTAPAVNFSATSWDGVESDITWNGYQIIFAKHYPTMASRHQVESTIAFDVTHYASFQACFVSHGAYTGSTTNASQMYVGLTKTRGSWVHVSSYHNSGTKIWPTLSSNNCIVADIQNATGAYYLAIQMLSPTAQYAVISDSAFLYGRRY